MALVAMNSPMQAAEEFACPIVTAPSPQFIPPAPFKPYRMTDGRFLLGTAGLWALVTPRWTKYTGQKLPYFRQEFVRSEEGEPRMAVVARRLDKPAPLVWKLPRVTFQRAAMCRR
jgi:hypothetical protein